MGAAAIPLAVSAFQAVSALKQGKADAAEAKAEAKFQSKQAKADANAEMAAAELQAKKVRDLARSQRGAARAALAASGVDVGAGSAVTIDQQITSDAESDAQMTIFGGKDVQARGFQQASAAQIIGKKQASAAKSGARATALGALAGGVDSFGEKGGFDKVQNSSGWKKMRDIFGSKGA